jgi:hypothetical protein
VPVWHVSVALHDYQGLVPTEMWSEAEWLRAALHAGKALRGVGRWNDWMEQLEYSLHVRRMVSESEMKVIGPATDVRSKEAT